MKRLIKASSFKKIDTVNFTGLLRDALKQMLPKNCRITINPKYDMMQIENCPSAKRLDSAMIKSLTKLGYNVVELADEREFTTLAAIKGDAWAKVSFTYVDWEDFYEVYIDCNNGNVIFEDWYSEDIFASEEAAVNEMPNGYLRTTKFTAPSIKTDDQRNALEAFEIAVSQKFKQFDDFMDRQMYLTSDTSWSGKIQQYIEGYWIILEGTRSGFQAFVDGDRVIRKPNPSKLTELIGVYDVNGNGGTVYYMSRNRMNRS